MQLSYDNPVSELWLSWAGRILQLVEGRQIKGKSFPNGRNLTFQCWHDGNLVSSGR
jgi:hypothetical protein